MSEIRLLCFLQGIDKEFYVYVDETNTIKNLREVILARKGDFVLDKKINQYKIWKVSVPTNDSSELEKLRKNPAEINCTELEDDQVILETFGKDFNEKHIQVFMSNSAKNIPTLEYEIKRYIFEQNKELIREFSKMFKQYSDMIQLTKINDSSDDEDVDGYLRDVCKAGVIKPGNELWISKKYRSRKNNSLTKDVDIGCKVTKIDDDGKLTVVLIGHDGNQKSFSSLESLEKWLLAKFDLDKKYRPKFYSHSRDNILVIHEQKKKSIKQRYTELENNNLVNSSIVFDK